LTLFSKATLNGLIELLTSLNSLVEELLFNRFISIIFIQIICVISNAISSLCYNITLIFDSTRILGIEVISFPLVCESLLTFLSEDLLIIELNQLAIGRSSLCCIFLLNRQGFWMSSIYLGVYGFLVKSFVDKCELTDFLSLWLECIIFHDLLVHILMNCHVHSFINNRSTLFVFSQSNGLGDKIRNLLLSLSG